MSAQTFCVFRASSEAFLATNIHTFVCLLLHLVWNLIHQKDYTEDLFHFGLIFNIISLQNGYSTVNFIGVFFIIKCIQDNFGWHLYSLTQFGVNLMTASLRLLTKYFTSSCTSVEWFNKFKFNVLFPHFRYSSTNKDAADWTNWQLQLLHFTNNH